MLYRFKCCRLVSIFAVSLLAFQATVLIKLEFEFEFEFEGAFVEVREVRQSHTRSAVRMINCNNDARA